MSTLLQRTCPKCKQVKQLIEFSKSSSKCKNCAAFYYQQNKERVIQRNKNYRTKNKKQRQQYAATYFQKNYYLNPQKYISTVIRRMKERIVTEPEYKLLLRLRGMVHFALQKSKGTKQNSTKDLLGCSIEQARKHIESQFQNGMTWENYGLRGWHIDHIIPCSAFNLTKIEEQKKCFHYTNLQPLWAKDNLRKSNYLPDGSRPH